MSWGAVAGAAVVTVGGLVAANQKSKAAEGAANAQKSGAKNALAEEQRQFDLQFGEYQRKQQLLEQQNEQIRQNLAPYIQSGQGALFEMMALSGVAIPTPAIVPQGFNAPASSIIDQKKLLPAPSAPQEPGKLGIMKNISGTVTPQPIVQGFTTQHPHRSGLGGTQAGPLPVTPAPTSPYAGMTGEQAQATAIDRIANSPILQELTRQGEEAILQNASATGGLRGGNVQGVLARYRPQMLQQEIDKQYARLGGLSGMGQSAISQTPTQVSVGSAPTSNAADYYARMGDINAQRLLTEAEAQGQTIGAIGKGIGTGIGAYYQNRQKPKPNSKP
ncbi:MAG: hypothetical protein PVJ60_00025 [Phycisphaerales bacterium]|jgi:hypothetical protein